MGRSASSVQLQVVARSNRRRSCYFTGRLLRFLALAVEVATVVIVGGGGGGVQEVRVGGGGGWWQRK